MDTWTAGWVQIALAALCLLSLALALVTTVRLRAIRDESVALDDTDTKMIVKMRLLEARVFELEAHLAVLDQRQGSTDDVPDVVDLRAALTGGRQTVSRVIRVPSADS